ncbi:MAG: PQQ-like beta-propeller repeat protein [Thermogutta sp.]|uniref:outer membrane protein assembly factor BamB family protein n=1 Tax=Thermogutta sp. TaxID=1962930 RepID=UPI00199882F6|nr:PQQ-binding-like beta-propeller repeat protein [Thermogutta sp.]MBC7353675.1 PQQ-like beta-propeller repeat protein [Thermogutta sp.]
MSDWYWLASRLGRFSYGLPWQLKGFAKVGCLLAVAFPTVLWADNWPTWRGPEGTGVCRETGLPLRWSEETGEGIIWKTEIPEWGNSTPVIWGNAIFLTTQSDDRLLVLRVDKATGRIVWTRQVGTADTPTDAPRGYQKFHKLNNNASPSVVTDGEHVVAHFGNGDLAVFTFAGELLWRRNLQRDYGRYTIWWGHANSPVIVDGLVISVCMQDSLADLQEKPQPSYVVAHDVKSGKEVWYTPRMTGAEKESCDAYTTPLVRRVGDRAEIIVMGAEWLDCYDARTGQRLWYLPGLKGNRTITGPTIAGDIVYATIGMRGATFAARIGGTGELPADRILWRYEGNNPDSPSPVYYEGLLYLAADNGVAQCLDAKTGELKWRERVGRDIKASPIAAEGRIYFLDTAGQCTVVRAGEKYEVLAVNRVNDRTVASPAVSDGQIFIRGRKYLYCLGVKVSSNRQ